MAIRPNFINLSVTFGAVSASTVQCHILLLPISPQSLEAHITLIPKSEKDHTQCNNYRPISLIGTDLKLYAKIIANRPQPLLSKTIHDDKVGFVMGREACDNTLKTLLLFNYARRAKVPKCLLPIDTGKAFNHINWGYLQHALTQW